MRKTSFERLLCTGSLVLALLGLAAHPAAGQLNLGPEEIVQAGGANIVVPSYSVPSFVYWNDDGLKDLIIGEKTDSSHAKVRVYLNVGTSVSDPQFSGYTYAQYTAGGDVSCTPSGCLGCFPRVVYWNADARKDLLVGQAGGTVKLFLNTGTEASPTFDNGTLLQVGPPDEKTDINVGGRACPVAVDWNSDGRKDLVAGAIDGKIHIFINEGTDSLPVFWTETFAQEDGADLGVPSGRSSPHVQDLDDDGKKDLLAGNSVGQLLFYSNVGTDAAPTFSGCEYVEADGVVINIGGTSWTRSRPFVCDWTGDGLLDVLIGSADGKVRLYQGVPTVTPPALVSAASRKSHGVGEGDWDIDLPLDEAAVESRQDNAQRILLAFSEPVNIDCTNIVPSIGTCSGVIDLGSGVYEVGISGAPDETCLTITLAGVTDLDGTPLTGDNDVQVVLLCGDVNGDGVVDGDDEIEATNRIGQPLDQTNARYDVDRNGHIDVVDVALIRDMAGHSASCAGVPPELVAAASRRTHSAQGDFDITLALAVESSVSEPRTGGPQRIVLTFSESVNIGCANISLSGGASCTGVIDLGGGAYEVGISGVPDASCLALTLIGVTDLEGMPLTGDDDVHVRALTADTNDDANADLIDMAQVKSKNGQPLGPSTARFDLNLDGSIDLIDMALAKSRNGNATSCP